MESVQRLEASRSAVHNNQVKKQKLEYRKYNNVHH